MFCQPGVSLLQELLKNCSMVLDPNNEEEDTAVKTVECEDIMCEVGR